MDYIFQVGKRVEEACGTIKKVRIGHPVDVTADCLDKADEVAKARKAAATEIIVRGASYNPKAGWVNPSDSYDLWLQAEAGGHDNYGGQQFFWYYSEVNTTG